MGWLRAFFHSPHSGQAGDVALVWFTFALFGCGRLDRGIENDRKGLAFFKIEVHLLDVRCPVSSLFNAARLHHCIGADVE